jgi:hypothetical protein
MNINEICTDIITEVKFALGCAVIDLNSGLLVGIAHKVPYFSQPNLDAAAVAGVEMFRGRTVMAVEQMISRMRGKEEYMMIEEIQMTTKNTYHFMAVIAEKPNNMVVLITTKQINLGMGWSTLRTALPKLAPFCS